MAWRPKHVAGSGIAQANVNGNCAESRRKNNELGAPFSRALVANSCDGDRLISRAIQLTGKKSRQSKTETVAEFPVCTNSLKIALYIRKIFFEKYAKGSVSGLLIFRKSTIIDSNISNNIIS